MHLTVVALLQTTKSQGHPFQFPLPGFRQGVHHPLADRLTNLVEHLP